jgi:pyruvate/2-oxoglutarate dehydrogenase complex dihydrolipoamide dehydrogenase (E3) component
MSEESGEFDFVVIGGGSAGFAGATLAARLGMKVALVEGAREMGGLCILRGCMPSKTLIESANRFMTLRRAKEFGLRAENISLRGEEIIERKRRLVADFGAHRRDQLEHGPFELVRGWGKFIDPHTIEVQGEGSARRLRGKSFLIATGSSLKFVDVPGLAASGFLDSDAVLESAHIPKSVVMLGAGPIALEFAHYYSAVGTEVTIVQRGKQVLRDMDGDVAVAVSDALCARGVRFFLGTELIRVEKSEAGKRVIFRYEGAEHSAEAEEIVYGLGRAPNIEGLGIEAAGVKVSHAHVGATATQQTNVPHIFAAGDAAGPHEIVHIAIQQAEVAARNAHRLVRAGERKEGEELLTQRRRDAEEKALPAHERSQLVEHLWERPAQGRGDADPNPQSAIGNPQSEEPLEEIDYRLKLFVVFTEPQVASVGFSERELITAHAAYAVARYPFADLGKALVLGETEGFVKIMARMGTCEILGAAAVGPKAGELIHELAAAMYFRATAQDLLNIPHYHPTLSEIWTYPAEELVSSGP